MTFLGICGKIALLMINGLRIPCVRLLPDLRGNVFHGGEHAENIGFDFGRNKKSV